MAEPHKRPDDSWCPTCDEYQNDAYWDLVEQFETERRLRDAMGTTAGRVLVDAEISAKQATGEGYTFEQGRIQAAREILNSLASNPAMRLDDA